MAKCVICDKRPANGNELGRCAQCHTNILAMSKRTAQPQHFLTYRDNVVGLYSDGGGTLKPRLLGRSAEHLPKGKTIDLNVYCQGYSREMIKRFKACLLQLSQA